MAEGLIYRPELPIGPTGQRLGLPADSCPEFYNVVTYRNKVVAAYVPFYFVTTREILADFIALIRSEAWQEWIDNFADFVLWSHAGKILAVVHSLVDYEADPIENKVALISELDEPPTPYEGWPTREQWIERGKGPLWFHRYNSGNPAD
jgi:hypothetical protein